MKQFIKTFNLSLSLGLGRITGIIREAICFYFFGANSTADYFTTLFSIPDTANSVFNSGTSDYLLIPALKKSNNIEQLHLISKYNFLNFVFTIVIAIATLYYTFNTLQSAFPLKFTTLSVLCLCFSTFIALLTGFYRSLLLFEEKFFIAGIGNFILNLFLISALIIFIIYPNEVFTSLLLVSSFTCRAIIQYFPWKKKYSLNFKMPDKKLVNKYFLIIFATATPHLINLYMRFYLPTQKAGQAASFSYCLKFIELPISLAIGPVTVFVLRYISPDNQTKKIFNKLLFITLTVSSIFAVTLIFGVKHLSHAPEFAVKSLWSISGIEEILNTLSLLLPILLLKSSFLLLLSKLFQKKNISSVSICLIISTLVFFIFEYLNILNLNIFVRYTSFYLVLNISLAILAKSITSNFLMFLNIFLSILVFIVATYA